MKEALNDTGNDLSGGGAVAGRVGGDAGDHQILQEFPQFVQRAGQRVFQPRAEAVRRVGDGADLAEVDGDGRIGGQVFIGHEGGEENPIINNSGSSQPHNNMPPYLSVYIWKRTA